VGLFNNNQADGCSVALLGKLLAFSQAINRAEDKAEVINAFLKLLADETDNQVVGSVGVFIKNPASNRLDVTIIGINNPALNADITDENLRSALNIKESTVIKRNQHPAGYLEEKLFHHKLAAYILTPIISGNENYGTVKIDLLKGKQTSRPESQLSSDDEHYLQLLVTQLANRLEDLEFRQQLVTHHCEHFFDKTILALKNNANAHNALTILCQQLEQLVSTSPASLLPTKWDLYHKDSPAQLKHWTSSNNLNKSTSPSIEPYYSKNSHIWHFMESGESERIYTITDLKNSSLNGFNGDWQASLCIRTELRVNQVPNWGASSEWVYVVLWSKHPDALTKYQVRYQELVYELVRQIQNKPNAPVKVDENYFKKTRDVFDLLFSIKNTKPLKEFLVKQAKILVPGSEAASYGEVHIKAGQEPIISIIAVTDTNDCPDKYRKFPHPLKNGGLWERLWETQTTITVNNNYEKPTFGVMPIDNPRSAIAVPVFQDNKLHGVLSLCSSKENVFLSDKKDVLEWLVQAFSGKLRELTKNRAAEHQTSDESREIQAIQALINFFTDDDAESKRIEEIDDLVKAALMKIIPSIGCSSWGLFKGDDNRYELLAHQSLNIDNTALNNLRFTPVGDVLRGERKELLAGTLPSDNRFTKLKNLLPTATNSCLALPIRIQEYRSPDQTQTDIPRAQTRLLAIFLFHFHADQFNYGDLMFLKLAISLLEALIQQRAFQKEIDRITPLAFSGEAAASIAHEIKNPCQPLRTFITMMETAWQENLWVRDDFCQGMKTRLQDANKALDRINENVVKLIQLSDITHFTPELVPIADMLKSVSDYQWYGETLTIKEPPIKIMLDELPLHLPAIRYSKVHLSTILTNLIKNAVQAIEGSAKRVGEIHIGAVWHETKSTDDKKLGLEPRVDKHHDTKEFQEHLLEIYIKDDGPGISAEVKRRMFLPFETTKKTGTGLGCTICQRMMHTIGGVIKVDSVLGQGATMRLLFHRDSLVDSRGRP